MVVDHLQRHLVRFIPLHYPGEDRQSLLMLRIRCLRFVIGKQPAF